MFNSEAHNFDFEIKLLLHATLAYLFMCTFNINYINVISFEINPIGCRSESCLVYYHISQYHKSDTTYLMMHALLVQLNISESLSVTQL